MLSEDDLREAVLLVFANKSDLPNAMSESEVKTQLGLENLKNRTYNVQPSIATNGEGLYNGLDWLSNSLRNASSER